MITFTVLFYGHFLFVEVSALSVVELALSGVLGFLAFLFILVFIVTRRAEQPLDESDYDEIRRLSYARGYTEGRRKGSAEGIKFGSEPNPKREQAIAWRYYFLGLWSVAGVEHPEEWTPGVEMILKKYTDSADRRKYFRRLAPPSVLKRMEGSPKDEQQIVTMKTISHAIPGPRVLPVLDC
ncbi:MAG: hypothetical protein WC802_01345 [Patescibacteria group bacterium]|jgi:hypothetical protein